MGLSCVLMRKGRAGEWVEARGTGERETCSGGLG